MAAPITVQVSAKDIPEVQELIGRHAAAMLAAEAKAWESLGKYKFWMFGYHAAQWVLLNRVSGAKRPNPWAELVRFAAGVCKQRENRSE